MCPWMLFNQAPLAGKTLIRYLMSGRGFSIKMVCGHRRIQSEVFVARGTCPEGAVTQMAIFHQTLIGQYVSQLNIRCQDRRAELLICNQTQC